MEKAFITAYGPKNKVTLHFQDPSRTRQSMKDEANINFILAKYQRTGLITHVAKHKGDYGEFAAIDFHEAMNAISEAQEVFSELPAELRKRFHNDPGEFLDFTTNPENLEEMRSLGLAHALPKDPPAAPTPPPADAPSDPEPAK